MSTEHTERYRRIHADEQPTEHSLVAEEFHEETVDRLAQRAQQRNPVTVYTERITGDYDTD